jgi:hypothetical protein
MDKKGQERDRKDCMKVAEKGKKRGSKGGEIGRGQGKGLGNEQNGKERKRRYSKMIGNGKDKDRKEAGKGQVRGRKIG